MLVLISLLEVKTFTGKTSAELFENIFDGKADIAGLIRLWNHDIFFDFERLDRESLETFSIGVFHPLKASRT